MIRPRTVERLFILIAGLLLAYVVFVFIALGYW